MNLSDAHKQAKSLGIGDLIIDGKGLPMFLTQKGTHQRFEMRDGTSDKFWEVELNDNTYTVHYGRIGSAGTSQTKRWATKEKCQREYNKKVREKENKGYKKILTGAIYHFDNPAGKPTTVTYHENDVVMGLTRKGWSLQKKVKTK